MAGRGQNASPSFCLRVHSAASSWSTWHVLNTHLAHSTQSSGHMATALLHNSDSQLARWHPCSKQKGQMRTAVRPLWLLAVLRSGQTELAPEPEEHRFCDFPPWNDHHCWDRQWLEVKAQKAMPYPGDTQCSFGGAKWAQHFSVLLEHLTPKNVCSKTEEKQWYLW